MTIKWTPWLDVPLHRRLEVISAAFGIFVGVILGPLSFLFMIYFLLFGSTIARTICLLYVIFICLDQNGDCRPGIGSKLIRAMVMFKHLGNYFPAKLVKTAELPADRNYLVCPFPHGVLCQSALVNFVSMHSKWSEFYPKVRAKCATLRINFYLPLAREMAQAFGMTSASAKAVTKLLTQSNDPHDSSNNDGYTSNATILMVGGAQEALYAHPNTYKLALKERKGFVRIAIKTGASLVPAISFGENNIYEQISYPQGSWGRSLQMVIKRFTRVCPIHFNGRGFLQYNYGFIPRRHPITTVIGAPICVTKHRNPSEDEVNELHALFCKQLTDLFETHKAKYMENSNNIHLEFL